MNRVDDRLPPALLLCAQALVWPGAALVRGPAPDASALLVAVLVAGSVTAALALRRARPVLTLVLVAAACALGAGPLPTGATAVLGTAGIGLALFTVAAERDTFTAVLCVVALALWQSLQNLSLHGLSDRDGLDLVLTTLLYAVTFGSRPPRTPGPSCPAGGRTPAETGRGRAAPASRRRTAPYGAGVARRQRPPSDGRGRHRGGGPRAARTPPRTGRGSARVRGRDRARGHPGARRGTGARALAGGTALARGPTAGGSSRDSGVSACPWTARSAPCRTAPSRTRSSASCARR